MATRHDPDGTVGPGGTPAGDDGTGATRSDSGSTAVAGTPATDRPDTPVTSHPDTPVSSTGTTPATSTGTPVSSHPGSTSATSAGATVTDQPRVTSSTTAAPRTASRTPDVARDEALRAEATEHRRTTAYELARARSRNTVLTDFGLLLLRLLPIIMFLHGLAKVQNFAGFRDGVAQNSLGALAPDVFALMIVAGQLALPIMIALGFLTRLAALLMTIMMVFIWVLVLLPEGLIDPANGGIRGESALLFAFLALPLIFTGPGRFSLDQALFGKRADNRAHKRADKSVA